MDMIDDLLILLLAFHLVSGYFFGFFWVTGTKGRSRWHPHQLGRALVFSLTWMLMILLADCWKPATRLRDWLV